MSEPIKDPRPEFQQMFREACARHFNYDLMVGAVRVKAGAVAPCDTRLINAWTTVTAGDAAAGKARAKILELSKALYYKCVNHDRRNDGQVPCFRTMPTMEVPAFDGTAWKPSVWCDMAWIPYGADQTSLEGAFDGQRRLSGADRG